VPLAIWGGLIGLTGIIPIVGAHFKPILANALEIPSVKRGFRASFVESAAKSCVETAQSRRATGSEAELQSRCQCGATAIVDGLTADEFASLILEAKHLPPELRDKIASLVSSCR
jgi:hypothetical protein